jgi:hypothetical protein
VEAGAHSCPSRPSEASLLFRSEPDQSALSP